MPNPDRPFWSVMIPVYNSTKYLARTLESVLDQDPGPDAMQIEVVDGYSTVDLPESLVQQIGGGRVDTFRHARPLSMAANWNSCIERARGEWVHILHSDDYVLPGFYSRLEEALRGRSDVGGAFTHWNAVHANGEFYYSLPRQMDAAGILPDRLDRLGAELPIQFAAMVVRKSAYDQVGGFSSDLKYALDWEMWVRLAARYPIWYEPQPLACYRVHEQSESTRLRGNGEDLADQTKAIPIIASYLPADSKARAALALHLIAIAKAQLVLGLQRDALRSLALAIRLDRSRKFMASAMELGQRTVSGAFHAGLRRLGLQ